MHLNNQDTLNLVIGNASPQIGYEEAKRAFQLNSNWWTVIASFDLPDFQPSAIWISTKTGIELKEVVEALEGLLVLGMLKSENGFIKPVKNRNFFEFDWKSKSKSEIKEEHAIVSQQILNDMNDSSLVVFDHRCFAGNLEIISKLYSDIKKAFDNAFEAAQNSKNQENDRVFKITFTAVDALKITPNEMGDH
jgi:hypothetical protein